MNNKNLYLYLQRFFSKILVKYVNSKHTNLSKKSYNSSAIFFKSKNRKLFLSYKHPKKKLFVILVFRGKWSILFSTPLAKELNDSQKILLEKICFKGKSYFFSLALRLPRELCPSLTPCIAPLGRGFSKVSSRWVNYGPLFQVVYFVHPCFVPFWGVSLITHGTWFIALKSSLKTTGKGSFSGSLAYFPSRKSLLRTFNLAKEVNTGHNLVQFVFFDFFCVAQPAFPPSFVKNMLENTTPKTKYLVFSKHYFFKRIKKVKKGKWSILLLHKRGILKTFYFVFCMFLKTNSQNINLNLLLDSLSASKFSNKNSLILINFYRICKLYKQVKKTQIVINQKIYNNLKFLNFKFENCLLIIMIIKSKPFIQRIEYLQIKSFNYYNFQIVRPLLSITRLDTFYLSESLKLPIYPDKTNLKVQFLRNRIRKQILPAIRILVNPQFDTILCNFSESQLVIKNINKF